MSFDLSDVMLADPPDVDVPAPAPDPSPVEADTFCPRCGDRLFFEAHTEYVYELGRTVDIVDGWGYCEQCCDDDVADAMAARLPWRFDRPQIDDPDDCGHRYYRLGQP